MKEKILRHLLKKQEGNAFLESAIATCIVVTFMLFFGFGYSIWMNEYAVNDKMDLILTAEMKSMEIDGCLTMAEKNNLLNDLQNIGLSDINISGDIGVEQDYGKPISLTVAAKLDLANSGNATLSGMVNSIRKLVGSDDIGVVHFGARTVAGTAKN